MSTSIAPRWSNSTLAESLGATPEWINTNLRRLGIAPAFRSGSSVFYGPEAWLALKILIEIQRGVDEPRSGLAHKIVSQSMDVIRSVAEKPADTVVSYTNGNFRLVVGVRVADLIAPKVSA
jgi:hypothetical protein